LSLGLDRIPGRIGARWYSSTRTPADRQGKRRCRIGFDRAEGGWIVEIEDPAAVMCRDLAQQRGLANRPWPLEENDGVVCHVLKGDGQDAALPQCRLPTVHHLTVALNAIFRGHSMRFFEGCIRGRSRDTLAKKNEGEMKFEGERTHQQATTGASGHEGCEARRKIWSPADSSPTRLPALESALWALMSGATVKRLAP
jgi:hypothetical protein